MLSDCAAELVGSRFAVDEVVAALERALAHTEDEHLRIGVANAVADARDLRRRPRTLEAAARGLRA